MNWPKCPNNEHHPIGRTEYKGSCWWWECPQCVRHWPALDGIPAAPPAPAWIPVTERLPKVETYVPILFSDSDCLSLYLAWRDEHESWHDANAREVSPTHWLDLPPFPVPAPVYETPEAVADAVASEWPVPDVVRGLLIKHLARYRPAERSPQP